MTITSNLAMLLFSIALLVLSADKFVALASKIGTRLKIPQFIIGLTIVAIGTSLPELVTSLISARAGDNGIAIGNVLGSNIANILLIIGIAGIIAKKLTTARNLVSVDLPFLVGSILLLFVFSRDGIIGFGESLTLFSLIVAYYLFVFKLQGPIEFMGKSSALEEQASKADSVSFLDILLLLLSGVIVFWSAKEVVGSASALAFMIGISQAVIATTIIAVGTSLPELAVSLQAIRKKQGEMAIGNVVGSNIFNTLAVVGLPGLFGKLVVPGKMLAISLPFAVITTLIFVVMIRDRVISAKEGGVMLGLYILFAVGLYLI